MSEAATPTGGAEGSARPQAAQQPSNGQQQNSQVDKPSVHDRIKAAIFSEPEPQGSVAPQTQQARSTTGEFAKGKEQAKPAQPAQEAEPDQQAEPDAPAGDDPNGEEQQTFSSFDELAEALGWEPDRLFDLEAVTKIDGKDGKVKFRDLVKSYQLEKHLNQKLMTAAEEKKNFEAEFGRKAQEIQQRVSQVNQAVTLAQRILDAEFADVDWPKLQSTNPAEFNERYGAYKVRQDAIQQLAQTVQAETEKAQQARQAEFNSYLQEQVKLLESKVPEWADKGKREKGAAELAATLSEAYGISAKEFHGITDHRHFLIALDAMRWQKLQKSKPATLQKVRTAPKLIRPGSQQSRSAQDGMQANKDRDQLRRTGRVQDALPSLKRHLFPQ